MLRMHSAGPDRVRSGEIRAAWLDEVSRRLPEVQTASEAQRLGVKREREDTDMTTKKRRLAPCG
eukprot:1726927-Rhodomonas_salina.2